MKCARCNRELKNPKYATVMRDLATPEDTMAHGVLERLGPYGPVCAKKSLQMPLTLKELKESMVRAELDGEIIEGAK